MRFEINTLGEIVTYDGSTQFVDDLDNKIIDLFSQNTFNCEIVSKVGSVYTINITNEITNKVKVYDVYYGNIRNESRNNKEKKIQLNGKDPRNSTNTAIILGFYCFDSSDTLNQLICCAWNIDETVNYPSNPSIRGINIDLFQEAKFYGFVKKGYRNNVVCSFKPEFIHFYLHNQNEIHLDITGNSTEINIENGDIKIQNKIYYGAPGTGKSHKVKELLKGKEEFTERITFHPEYDYASFVGGYKPITEKDSDTGKEEIKYKFIPQAFTNIYVDAWNDTENDYYLVIEEINRGNCAEIFGDIFQLLDRNPEYLITPSNELKEHLEKSLTEKGLENGKMVLPSNLHILATMNTSDQSLFPMDSAFKRRWDWEYIPIDYIESEENPSSRFIVKISETEDFSWIKFIEKVNKEYIQVNPNLGMDKCIGNYFIKAVDNEIELSDFINKAIFYLWNDVFKDEEEHIFEENTFYEDFFPIDTNGKGKVIKMLEKIGLTEPKED